MRQTVKGVEGFAKRAVAAIAASLVFAACPPPHIGPDPCSIDPLSILQPVTTTDRLAAMLSVHAHAYAVGERGSPSNVIPLCRAAVILMADDDALAWSRRRRAVAKLMGFGRLGTHFQGPLHTLHANVPAIRQALAIEAEEHTARRLETLVSNLLNDKPELADLPAVAVKKCDWRQEEEPDVTGTTTSVSVDLEISVAPKPSVVAYNVDPQRWDDCSKFWKPPPDSTYIEKLVNGTYQKEPMPPQPGTPYGSRPAFEHFSCMTGGCSAWFKNHLTVSAHHNLVGSTTVRLMGYSLPKDGYIDGRVLNVPTKVVLDEGWVEMRESSGRTFVSSHKKIAFSPAVVTGLAQTALGWAELNEELAELACCGLDK